MKLAILWLCALTAFAGQPQLKTLKVSWNPYTLPTGTSNAVVTIFKSTSLGSIYSPFKPTAIAPASRTNTTVSVLPGHYRFYATATVQPLAESEPSGTVTVWVGP